MTTAAQEIQHRSQPTPPVITAPDHKKRIVIGDDDKLIISVVRERLEREGFEVVSFFNGADAFKSVMDSPVSLVLVDTKMRGMFGYELLERMRDNASFDKVPFVMMISPGSEKDIPRGLKLGANDYIVKPFSLIDLLAKMRRLLK